MFNMFGGLFSANKFKMLPSVVYRLEMVADKGLSTKKMCQLNASVKFSTILHPI